jgi:hypothetical protein
MSIMRPRRALVAVAGTLLAFGTSVSAASALNDTNGQHITNTGNPQAQLVGGPSVVQKLFNPASPGDDDPSALNALGDLGDPESDLGDALDSMGAAAAAGDRTGAANARQLAINILEGNPIARKAYSGMPLLNWNAPAKIKNVPAGGNVVVREVRFGETALSDTWLLSFDDPSQPYTITFRVTELGTQFGGALTPAPLLEQGSSAVGGESQALVPLVPPLLATGTNVTNRNTPNGGPEFTRAATQDITVAMPPAGMTDAVLEPNLQPGAETLMTLERTTQARLDSARNDFGFSTTSPSAADKLRAISRIGDGAPEKELWGDLQQLDPNTPGFLNAAAVVASGDRQLVSAMRMRSGPPAGVPHDPSADVNVAFLNDESYLYRGSGALPQGGTLKVSATNADNFTHQVQALALSNASPLGAIGWGEFTWQPVALDGDPALSPGTGRTYNLNLPNGTFAVWLGDPNSGDQAAGLCGLPTNGGVDQASLPCPIAFKGVGDQPAGGHVKVPDQGRFGTATTLTTSQVQKRLLSPACDTARWIRKVGKKARIGLLGITRAKVLDCYGRPSRAAKSGTQERWRYGSSLTVRLNKGRVMSFILRGKKYVGVNKLTAASPMSKVRKALGKNAYDTSLKSYRAVIKMLSPKSRYADMRLHAKSRKAKRASRVDAKLVTRKQLNRLGRSLSVR